MNLIKLKTIRIISSTFFSHNPVRSEISYMSFPDGASGKASACQCSRNKNCGFDPWVRKIPWSRKCQPTPVFLPGKSHGQRSLVGYSSWGLKELDMTEGLPYLSLPRTALNYLVLNPFSLQVSCLENPMDRGAWQATVHRVAESDKTEVT